MSKVGGKVDLSNLDILPTRRVFQMRTSAILVQETLDFLKFMVCMHGQGGRTSAIFCGQGGKGVNFS